MGFFKMLGSVAETLLIRETGNGKGGREDSTVPIEKS